LKEVEAASPWFGTAKEIVAWFRQRRGVTFRAVERSASRIEVVLQNVPVGAAPDFSLRVSWANAQGHPAQMELALQGRDRFSFDLPGDADIQRTNFAVRKNERGSLR
jgi:hypothetical protein